MNSVLVYIQKYQIHPKSTSSKLLVHKYLFLCTIPYSPDNQNAILLLTWIRLNYVQIKLTQVRVHPSFISSWIYYLALIMYCTVYSVHCTLHCSLHTNLQSFYYTLVDGLKSRQFVRWHSESRPLESKQCQDSTLCDVDV